MIARIKQFVVAHWPILLAVVLGIAGGAMLMHQCTPKPVLLPTPSIPAPVVSAQVAAAKEEGRAEAKAEEAKALEPTIAELKAKIQSTKKPVQRVDAHALSDDDLAGMWTDAGF